MFQTLKNAWKLPDLRKKILYTLFIIAIFRLGAAIPVPFLDRDALADVMSNLTANGSLLSYFNSLSGGAFENATLFAMSVTPYINSSIIMQLLTVAIPALERLQKEGEEGRKKIAQITRYVTVILGILQGFAYYMYIRNTATQAGAKIIKYDTGFDGIFAAIVIILTFTAGTALMMWLGEQINQRGIGNGISMLLFAGIISSGPTAFYRLYVYVYEYGIKGGEAIYILYALLMVIIFLAMIAFIVFMDNAERRIPVQYAKRVVGRKLYGGQNTHIPIKVNMSGVMPIIFASSILAIPATILMFISDTDSFWYKFLNAFRQDGYIYAPLYFILILAFAYFYVTIQYNPIEMANNLRTNGGAIPGIRSGKPTSDFISKIVSRITLIGALFLSVIAILPIILQIASNDKIIMGVGGTSIIILVGVALETVRQLESQMLMRHYKGFLE